MPISIACRRIVDLAGVLALAACAPRTPPPAPAPRFAIVEVADTVPDPVMRGWPAMGTTLRVIVWDADTTRALAVMESARAAVARADSLMSAAFAVSEIAAANRRAGMDSTTTLSPWTAAVLDSALAVAAASGGAFDPTADSAAAHAGHGDVRFDRGTRQVWLPARGMRLDLGGIARGFAIDRALDALRAAGAARAVIDMGGNFAMLGPAPVGPRWSVGLKNPFAPGYVYAAIQMDAGALSTAAGFDAYLESEGVLFTHRLDPRSRRPAHGVASVSVIAASALLSDGLSRAFYVLGPEAGCRLAARYPGVDAVWVRAAEDDDDREEDEEEAEEGIDPRRVVMTDALAAHLEVLAEDPSPHRPTLCSELIARSSR
jgi:thiamine biosynthesis lipoprotein